MKEFIRKVMSSNVLLITYDEILRHPVGSKETICEGFSTERLPTTKKVIFFRIELKKGVEIPLNVHDCFEEVGLYSGKVLETHSKKLLDSVKNIKIEPHEKHGFLALEDSVFYAYLYR